MRTLPRGGCRLRAFPARTTQAPGVIGRGGSSVRQRQRQRRRWDARDSSEIVVKKRKKWKERRRTRRPLAKQSLQTERIGTGAREFDLAGTGTIHTIRVTSCRGDRLKLEVQYCIVLYCIVTLHVLVPHGAEYTSSPKPRRTSTPPPPGPITLSQQRQKRMCEEIVSANEDKSSQFILPAPFDNATTTRYHDE